MTDVAIRAATQADLAAITAIYAAAVREGTGTFELDPPDVGEMARRHARIVAFGAPWLVAAAPDGSVAGYAYAGPFRERAAYRFTLEDSVYVAAAARGGGIGKALLDAVLADAARAGFRQMVALIGDSANVGSIRLHAACGFAQAGVMRDAGYKLGRWLDVVVMQRALGDGGTTAPSDRPQ